MQMPKLFKKLNLLATLSLVAATVGLVPLPAMPSVRSPSRFLHRSN